MPCLTLCRIVRKFTNMSAVIFIGDNMVVGDGEKDLNLVSIAGEISALLPQYKMRIWWVDPRENATLGACSWVKNSPNIKTLYCIATPSGHFVLLSVNAWSGEDAAQLSGLETLISAWQENFLSLQTYRQQAAFFKMLLDNTTDTIVYGDFKGIRHYISPSVTCLLGYTPEELLGQSAAMITHPEDAPTLGITLDKVINRSQEVGIVEIRQRHKSGEWIWMEASVRLAYNPETGQAQGYVASVRNIMHRKLLENRLSHLANRDTLTDLYNRKYFNDRLDLALADWTPDGPTLVLFYMDIDGFKRVNDSYGHMAGDSILQQVSGRLKNRTTECILLARIGGDEFTLLTTTTRQGAGELAAQLIDDIQQPFLYGNSEISIGLSIGIAIADDKPLTPDAFMDQADIALYAAKKSGRNTCRFFR